MDDLELINQKEDNAAPQSAESGLLQENSDAIKSLAGKFTTVQSQVTAELKPSEVYNIAVRQKLDFVEKELNKMKEQDIYGSVNIDSDGKPLELDMNFLDKKDVIPPEIKSGMSEEEIQNSK